MNGKRLDALAELVGPDFLEHGTPPISRIDGFRGFLEASSKGCRTSG